MHNEAMTGKRRYRVHRSISGKQLLVLQFEVSFGDGPDDYNGMPTYLSGKKWRDATVEDLSTDDTQP